MRTCLRVSPFVCIILCLAASASAKQKNSRWPAREMPAGEAFLMSGWGKSMVPLQAVSEAQKLAKASTTPYGRAVASLMLGLAQFRLHAYAKSETALRRALKGPLRNPDLAAFLLGETLFHQGRYAESRRVFNRFARQYPRSVWRHRAWVRVGDADLALGNYKAAKVRLTAVPARYPEYPHPAALPFAVADLDYKAGNFNEAAEGFEALRWALPKDPLIPLVEARLNALASQGISPVGLDEGALYERGLALRLNGYPEEALGVFQKAVQAHGTSSDQVELLWDTQYQIGRTLYKLQEYARALDQFEALRAGAPSQVKSNRATRWASHTLGRLGQFDEAASMLLASLGSPKTPNGKTLFKLGWLFFDGGQYEKAAQYFTEASKVGRYWKKQTRFLRAYLAYRLGDYAVAIAAFKGMQNQTTSHGPQAAYWLGRALQNAGDTDAASETYRGIVQTDPLSYYGLQAQIRLDEFGIVSHGIGPKSKDVLVQGTPPEGNAPGLDCDDANDRPGCRLIPKMGEGSHNEQNVGVDSRSGAQGKASFVQKQVKSRSEVEPFGLGPFDPMVALRDLAPWAAAFPSIGEAFELATIGENKWASGKLRQALDELRAFSKARRSKRRSWAYRPAAYVQKRKNGQRGEWGRVLNEKPLVSSKQRIRFLSSVKGKAFWSALYRAFRSLDDVSGANRLLGRRHQPKGAPDGADTGKWQRKFPRAYAPLVIAHSAHYGLDPNLLWALMKVESAFNPLAVSRAGARGLMQVMPRTGTLSAGRMSWRNFGAASLFEPEVAIEMAAWYFHELLSKFRGQAPLAIAGYNAGPHRVAEWLKRKGSADMDEFIEEVPYAEARGYTKRVLQYLTLYRRIYRGETRLRLGQTIDPTYEDNINF